MNTSPKSAALLAATGSFLLLGGAFVFQALGYAPCKLCLWQRWPHGMAIAVGLVILLSGRVRLAWLGALAALATAGVGIYHTGVERGFWIGPTSCSSSAIDGLSADDLMNQILNAPLVRCNEVAWSMLGLSMASWNAVFSLVLALVWLRAALASDAR